MSVPGFAEYVAESSRKTAILDSNLLVLHITGIADPDLLGKFDRVKAFTASDYILLNWIIAQFRSVVTSAYVLAEVSNLGNKLSGKNRDVWFAQLAKYARLTDEAHVATQTIGVLPEALRFGITDAALRQLSEDYVLITSEYRLSGYLEEMGKQVLNFNHLRPLWMLA